MAFFFSHSIFLIPFFQSLLHVIFGSPLLSITYIFFLKFQNSSPGSKPRKTCDPGTNNVAIIDITRGPAVVSLAMLSKNIHYHVASIAIAKLKVPQ